MKSLVAFVLAATVRVAASAPPPAPVDEPLDVVPFAFDSAAVDSVGRIQLHETARWIAVHPDRRLVIAGHTDAIGGDAYNRELAARRARAVRDVLVAFGSPRDRIVLAVYGKSNPPSRTPTAQANRVAIVYAMTAAASQLVACGDVAEELRELAVDHRL
jgi:outer membrane protein OmpA-like peptidoglycan-associated protein